MASIPVTRTNFRPGSNWIDFALPGLFSVPASRMVFFGLYVFWDIPCRLIWTKVKNALRIQLIILPFFLQVPQGFVLSQNRGTPDRLKLLLKKEGNDFRPVSETHTGPGSVLNSVRKNLQAWQDNGYPFAIFTFDSIRYAGREGSISGQISPGPEIRNGPVVLHGDSVISPLLISRWLGFRQDDAFSCTVAERAPGILKNIPFAEEWNPPELEWFGNQAVLHVYLRKSSSNTLNGVLGLMPGQTAGNKLLLTGNLEAGFTNLFNRGLGFSLRWTRFAEASQTAFLEAELPVLGYSGIGIKGQFELFRQDSLYFRQRALAEMGFGLSGLWKLKLGIQSFSSSQNKVQNQISSSMTQSVNSLLFGAEMESGKPGRIDPSRTAFSFRFLPGLKQKKDAGISTRYSQFELLSRGTGPLWKTGRRFWLRGSAEACILSSAGLSLADQFRIGGLRSLRGFNENQFFTSAHILTSVQPQWLLDEGFLLTGFCEGILFQEGLDGFKWQSYRYALGFGIGAEFEAGPNLIQISIANGIMKGLSPELSSSKIHFGYVARF